MGYFLGKRIPEYNPLWEEKDYEDKDDYWKWFHLGYDEGYGEGHGQYLLDFETKEKLVQENEALRALIAANYRTMKQEILKEIADTNLKN